MKNKKEPPLLCAIKQCPNPAPPRKRWRFGRLCKLNVCDRCIKDIQDRHGIK